MLHKSKSNKFRAWKYALILPVLALFLMNFSTKEIIIENEIDNSKENITNKSTEIGDIIEIIINKDFTSEDFKKVKEQFDKLGVTLKFSGIKRNKNNEIIAIKTEFKTPEGHTGNATQKGNKPITSFTFWYNQDTGVVGIGNRQSMTHKIHKTGKGNSSNTDMHLNEGYVYTTKEGKTKIHKSGKDSNVFVYSSNDDDEHEIIEDDDKIIVTSGAKIHEIKKVHKDKNVFVIAGDSLKVKKLDKEVIELASDTIHFKGNIKIKGKDGDVKIWTEDDDDIYELKTIGKKENNKFLISNSVGKQSLFILDGKEIPNKDVNDLVNPNNIKSINVLKGAAAIKLYGNKGKDGVIIITLKKDIDKKNPWRVEVSKVQFLNDKDKSKNGITFYISKFTSNQLMNNYKSELKNSNINVKYSKIKRNKAGEITSIKVSLNDSDGKKVSAAFQDNEGISTIAFGKVEGKLVVKSSSLK